MRNLILNPQCLESGIASALEDDTDPARQALLIELSFAISVKRIADAAETLAKCVGRGPDGMSFNVWKAGGAQ